jgi:hypothetical protein
MSEKQRAPRQKTFLRGFAYFGNSPSAIDCVVREFSETGARLTFSGPPMFSETLDLHIPIKGQSFHGKVQWNDGDELGIAFDTLATAATNTQTSDSRLDRLEAEIAALKQIVKRLQRITDDKTEAA